MAPDTKKIAEKYVKQQVKIMDGPVPKTHVRAAIRKVAEALEEVRAATQASQKGALNLK